MRHKFVLVIFFTLFVSVVCLGFSQNESFILDTPQNRRETPPLTQMRAADPSFIEKVKSNWSVSWDGATYDMAVDLEDNVLVAGRTPSDDAYLRKYSPLGKLLNTTTWGGSAYDSGKAVAIDSNSNVYLSGYTLSFGYPGIENCFLTKYNNSLVQQWNITWYISGENDLVDMVIDSEDNVVVIGNYDISGPSPEDLFIRKYNATGHLIWETQWGYGDDDYANKVVIDSEDNAYVWFRSREPPYGVLHSHMLKLNSSGFVLWDTKIEIYDLAIDSGDYLILLGSFGEGTQLRRYDNELSSYTQIAKWIDYDIYYYPMTLDNRDNIYLGGGWYCLMKFNDTGVNYWNFTKGESLEQYRLTDIAVDSQQQIYCLCNNLSDSHLFMYDNSSHTVTCLKTPKFPAKELYATIVGIGDYPGDDNDLNFPYKDRQAMLEHLRKECNVPSENIEIFSSATCSDIENALSDVDLVISEEDDYLFYFSGHGGTSSYGSYICPYDSLPPDPSSNRIYCDDLDWYLDRIECEDTYVFLDACHSGGFTTSETESGEFIMSSCTRNEVSIETFDLYHGVFTYYWLDSFSHATDTNENGLISLEERYTYISSQTAAYSASYGVSQHPQLYDGISGNNAFHPSADMWFSQDEKTVSYDLTVHGSGQIYDLFLHFYSDANVYAVNLSAHSKSTTTGFGQYTSTITVGEDDEVNECILTMDVKGEQYLTILTTFYPEGEDEEEEEAEKTEGLNLYLIAFLVALGVIAIGTFFYFHKKRATKMDPREMRSSEKILQGNMPKPETSVQVSVAAKYCVFCGQVTNARHAYCTYCGKKVSSK